MVRTLAAASRASTAVRAVVGAPSEETGEMVVAHVVMKDPAVSTDALRAHARTQLTGYKVPRRVVLHDALPKTNVGKVLRRVARAVYIGADPGDVTALESPEPLADFPRQEGAASAP